MKDMRLLESVREVWFNVCVRVKRLRVGLKADTAEPHGLTAT